MSQTKTTAQDDGTVNLAELPDARVTIDLSIVGRADTAPRVAADYCRQVAEYLEDDE